MKKLLLIVLLIVVLILTGCTRKYECDVGTIHPGTGEFHSIGVDASTTRDWGDFRYTKEDAKENCEASYNDGKTAEFHCICERSN